MNPVDEFTKKFTQEKVSGVMQLKRNFYQASQEVMMTKEKIKTEPFAIGTFLGSIHPFHPSAHLLDWLGGRTERFVVLDNKSSWLFLCGRDVFPDSVVQQTVSEGFALVKNERNEVLGYGEFTTTKNARNHKISIKNVFDKGDFLRRERR